MDRVEQTTEELVLSFLADGGDEFTSGEALSGKLGLSRTAVWKYVESLRDKGYRIEAVPARGYRLVEVPDRLTSLELAPLLDTHDLGRTLHSSRRGAVDQRARLPAGGGGRGPRRGGDRRGADAREGAARAAVGSPRTARTSTSR